MSQGRHDDEHLYVEKYRNGGGGGGGTASDIIYNDSNTHLGATNVQGAIEKTNDRINVTNGNIETINTQLTGKQDKLTAGTNINIDSNNVISALGTGVIAAYDLLNENLQFN